MFEVKQNYISLRTQLLLPFVLESCTVASPTSPPLSGSSTPGQVKSASKRATCCDASCDPLLLSSLLSFPPVFLPFSSPDSFLPSTISLSYNSQFNLSLLSRYDRLLVQHLSSPRPYVPPSGTPTPLYCALLRWRCNCSSRCSEHPRWRGTLALAGTLSPSLLRLSPRRRPARRW
jgi:hypothetical protein